MTQREAALADKLTPAMEQAARHEGLEPEVIRQGLARGTLVLPANRKHQGLKPIAIGREEMFAPVSISLSLNGVKSRSPNKISLTS